MTLTNVAWYLIVVFFAGMGVIALARPAQLLAPFGMRLLDADADAEVRGVYGGIGFAFAALLVYADVVHTRATIAPFIAVSLVCMSVCRLLSVAVRHPVRAFPTWFFIVVDASIGALALVGAGLLA